MHFNKEMVLSALSLGNLAFVIGGSTGLWVWGLQQSILCTKLLLAFAVLISKT